MKIKIDFVYDRKDINKIYAKAQFLLGLFIMMVHMLHVI
mgnify:CR=1 FL=1